MGGGGQNAEGLWTALIPPVGPGQNSGGDPGATPSKAPRFGVFKNTFRVIIAVCDIL